MRDYEAVLKACEGADCVFHVAACGMSGLEQASTIFLTFSPFILVKERSVCIQKSENMVKWYLGETEIDYEGQVIHVGNKGGVP